MTAENERPPLDEAEIEQFVGQLITGKGIPQSGYPPETLAGIERSRALAVQHQLVQHWIPSMPQVRTVLEAGGTALEVDCGSGLVAITLAKAFAKAQIWGYDSHAGSIERAHANGRAAGLEDRVRFEVMEGTRLPEQKFDFITTFEVVLDSVDPVGLLTSIRKALLPDGTYLMVEMNAAPTINENMNPSGKLCYSASTLYGSTTSLAHDGGGIGAVMGEPQARELAEQADFGQFRKLPIEDPLYVLYELRT